MLARGGERGAERERQDEVDRPGDEAFHGGEPGGVVESDLAGEVVVQPPAEACGQHRQRGPGAAQLRSVGTLISTAPAMIAIMPSAMRRSKFSRNTNQASRAVNTPSAFSSRDAPEAGMLESPTISRTGAMIPPVRIAPARGSTSRRRSRTRGCAANQAEEAQADPGAAVEQARQQPRADVAAEQKLRQRGAGPEQERSQQAAWTPRLESAERITDPLSHRERRGRRARYSRVGAQGEDDLLDLPPDPRGEHRCARETSVKPILRSTS